MPGGSGGGSNPDKLVGDSANKSIKLGEDWLKFSQDQFAISQDRQKELDALIKSVADKQGKLASDQSSYTKTVNKQSLGIADDVAKRMRELSDKSINIADDAAKRNRLVADKQLQTAEWVDQIARDDRQRYEDVYRPVEDEYIRQVNDYGSAAHQEEAAASAMGDVRTAAAASRASAQREMASLGINPNSGRWAGVDRAGELGTSLAVAGAANAARGQVRDTGLVLKGNVAQLGRGVSADALSAGMAGANIQNSALGAINTGAGLQMGARSDGIATAGAGANLTIGTRNNAIVNAGAAAEGAGAVLDKKMTNSLNANSQFLGATGIVGQGYAGAANGYNAAAGIWQGQQQRADTNNNAWLGAAGTGLGLLLSDEDVKTDKEPIGEGEALDAVRAMPVEKWRYKDGVGDEAEHIGTYAQDFQEQTGHGDGSHIPIGDAIGITMKAVQDLAGKVDKIATAVGLGGGKAPLRSAKGPARPETSSPGRAVPHPRIAASELATGLGQQAA